MLNNGGLGVCWIRHIRSRVSWREEFSRNSASAHHTIPYSPTSALFRHLSTLFLPIMMSVRTSEQQLFSTNKTFGGVHKHKVCKISFRIEPRIFIWQLKFCSKTIKKYISDSFHTYCLKSSLLRKACPTI